MLSQTSVLTPCFLLQVQMRAAVSQTQVLTQQVAVQPVLVAAASEVHP